jgi:hypothetical protein
MSLDTPLTIDSAGVTTTIVSDDVTLTNSMSTTHLRTDIASTSESIKDFLAKPYLVYTGSWPSTATPGTLLFGGFGLATDSFLFTLAPLYDKIKGFSMTRSTIVMRLQVNATPFHAGKLLMHFLPLAQYHSSMDSQFNTYVSMHNWSLTTRTQQPSIELDCRETAVELRIPYVSFTDYFVLGNGSGMPQIERGSIYLSVLAALKNGAALPAIDYSFYISFEDVELVAPVLPQAGKGRMGRMGATKEKEAKAMASTPIANALSVAGKVASTLGSIPVLSSIATPASWVLQAASGLASAFGWSKPTNLDVMGAASRQYQRFAATSDGTDYAYPLAMKVGNHVTTTTSKTITDQDEMSFAFLKSIEAYVETVNWATTAAQSTVLYSKQIGPRSNAVFSRAVKTKGTGSQFLDSMAPAFYISNQFRQYRGSFKLRIRIAKTDFHSGRLQVTFTPRPTPVATPTVTTSYYSLREIIDIRAGNEIEITLPYMLSVPYIDVETTIGQLDIIVLNQLRAPDTAAQSVDLLFYWCAGDDFELAVPGYSKNTVNWPPVAPQSGIQDMAADQTLLSEGIGGAKLSRADTNYAEFCVGEIFTSIRQQLSRYNQIWTKTLPPATGPRVAIWPFFSACLSIASADGAKLAPKYGGDLFSYYAPMYTFYRGGMRVQVDTAAAVGSISATITPGQLIGTREVFATSTSENGSNAAVAYVDNAFTTPAGTALTDAGIGLYAVELPYYCKTAVSAVIPTTTDAIPYRASTSLPEHCIPQSVVTVETQSTPVYYRAIAEDFQFLYFVGCPPLIRSTVALAAAPLPLLKMERDKPLADDGRPDEVLFFATA